MRLGPALALVRLLLLLPILAVSPSRALASPDGDIHDTDWHVDLSDYYLVHPQAIVSRNCPGQKLGCGEAIVYAVIQLPYERQQYKFDAVAGQLLTLGTDGPQGGDPMDTVLDLLSDDCETVLASDDDSGPAAYSLIQDFVAPYTGRYIAQVRGFDPVRPGTYSIYISCRTLPDPPADDDCGGVLQSLGCGAGTLRGETTLYQNDYDPFGPGSCLSKQADGRDVAIALDLEAGSVVRLTYSTSADGAVYILSDCALPGSCQIGVDERGPGEAERIPGWIAPETRRYYLILDSAGAGSSGSWTLDYDIVCRPPDAVCCLDQGVCALTTEDACNREGGTYLPGETTCEPNPCAVSPVRGASWGEVKARYR